MATTIASVDGEPIVSKPDRDGRRHFIVPYIAANWNNDNVRVRNPLGPIASLMPEGKTAMISHISIKTTAAVPTARFFIPDVSHLRTKLAQSPDWQAQAFWHFLEHDRFEWEEMTALDPHSDNDFVVTISGYSATDDMWIFFKGWF